MLYAQEVQKAYKKGVKITMVENHAAQQQGQLSEAAKEARRAYRRKWAAANREKVREYQNRYWERIAKEALTGETVNGKERNSR